ncbi:DEAD/DEAH box helicase [Mucilaginibacter daejeonensis]|uniref:DEAD/DEAH box helicase n=1 Tax=Mucilaginibacter daejeonensis TaxID=398049 RepID=UPI001D1710C8|nr:DEAD/DEAH box helicase [Mucilaginibacter daejeonensis]UEG55099.1 DEAD/DEAH box helicase [Mucilaginibacter daejeonensis]
MNDTLTGNNDAEQPYILPFTVNGLTELIIARNTLGNVHPLPEPLQVIFLAPNRGLFTSKVNPNYFPVVEVQQQDGRLWLTCPCRTLHEQLCDHQARVLLQLLNKPDLRIFFDDAMRQQKFRMVAQDYGLQHEQVLDSFFELTYTNGQPVIQPRQKALVAVTGPSLDAMKQLVFQPQAPTLNIDTDESTARILVFRQHKFYKHLLVELYDAPLSKEGRIKNPLAPVAALDQMWRTNDSLELKFFAAIGASQANGHDKIDEAALESLKAIFRNPLGLACYVHQPERSENVNATSLDRVEVGRITDAIKFKVEQKGQFYEVSASLMIYGTDHDLATLEVKYDCMVGVGQAFYLVKDLQMLGAIRLFSGGRQRLLIHHTRYDQFRAQILDKLEERSAVNYTYLKPATPRQLKDQGFEQGNEMIIYLSDFGQHVMVLPVMRYGEMEIPIRSQKIIHGIDKKGQYFIVKRNDEAEQQMLSLLIRQHPYFEEQITDDLQYFYLHKRIFLDHEWFLNAFEAWRDAGITILGFNEISNNKLNGNKLSVNIDILSGINWFNVKIKAGFGKQKASLKHLHKAIRNKSKFVQLDDGTLGVLPAEWIARFADYFNAGEIIEDELHVSRANFNIINDLYDDEMLDEAVRTQLHTYRQKLADFERIEHVDVPNAFNGTLRDYQSQGLNWLNFLDEFSFGGCLADDMGLGKTVQIIAFILSQRERKGPATDLLVVPTSLIFNWQAEFQKFAPSLKIHTLYGPDRKRNTQGYETYDVVITSYGTLLSDVLFLKDHDFNYVFLDESQNIKNPSSQRYKAARLLKARNRIAITGTPVENNTLDLYAQLSFASPGLLGSKQYFKEIYLMPIDQFKVDTRLQELRGRVSPFVLRRTKREVAAELPEKTEMVLYCDMLEEQRKMYDAYEREFREFISATTQEELPNSSMHVLRGITRLRQICDSPLLLKGEKLPGERSAKIEMLLEQLRSRTDQHKILVFSQFVTMLDLIGQALNKEGIGFAKLTGSTRDRQAVVDDFQTNPDTRVFLVSLKAGGTGLNLTAADYVYLVDPWWNPATENQAIDRAYRIGQDKHVVAVRMICTDTVEEKMMILQQNKKDLVDRLITSGNSLPLDREELLSLLKHPHHAAENI